MAQSGYTRIDVLFSAPGDIQEERRQAQWAVEELNETIGRDKRIYLRLLHWESHSIPDMGRPQGVINDQITSYDIYIGVMWHRFGTPTGRAGSGTEEEFNLAYESWEASDRPRIMFYFSQAPSMPQSLEDNDQMRKVLEFRNKVSQVGLTRSYTTLDQFGRYFREHIAKLLLFDRRFASCEDPATSVISKKTELEAIPKVDYGPVNDPMIAFPIVRFHVTNLDSGQPVQVRILVDILLDGEHYGRPVRHYSGEKLWNCNPGIIAAGWFRLTDADQIDVDENAAHMNPLTAQEVRLRVSATLIVPGEKEHKRLPMEWYYSRDRRLWVFDP
jgi:hypothetical protein